MFVMSLRVWSLFQTSMKFGSLRLSIQPNLFGYHHGERGMGREREGGTKRERERGRRERLRGIGNHYFCLLKPCTAFLFDHELLRFLFTKVERLEEL